MHMPGSLRKLGSGSPLIRQAGHNDEREIRAFLLSSSHLYPEIGKWWETKVKPDLARGRRIAFVVDAGKGVEGLFVGKPGRDAKLCTLRLSQRLQGRRIGSALLAYGLSHLLTPDTEYVHVTVSEATEPGCRAFFESFGFEPLATVDDRYVPGVAEYIYGSPVDKLAEVVRKQLGRRIIRTLFGARCREAPRPDGQMLVMSLRPEFADLVLSGKKTVEFRRRFSAEYAGAKTVFYVTSPVRQFLFAAVIAGVDGLPKTDLWSKYQHDGGVSKSVFDSYFVGTAQGFALRLADIELLQNTMSLQDARRVCPGLRPPQSFMRLRTDSRLVPVLGL
jgi:predicted transcriptional regulator/ribosomal protein S18 acetylase RimI-like enzyme